MTTAEPGADSLWTPDLGGPRMSRLVAFAIQAPAAVKGVALSNALKATTP